MLSEKALTDKDEPKKGDNDAESKGSDRYTIFHALFEAMKEKDKKTREK
jgi:hypothetical protein